jgi:hypothetical protein
VATRLLTASPVVRVDGPRSVTSAFRVEDAQALASDAGLDGAVVRRCRAFRWLLRWDRPA